MKSELLMALAPAFAQLSAQRIDYTEIMAHTFELAEALNDVLSKNGGISGALKSFPSESAISKPMKRMKKDPEGPDEHDHGQ